MKGGQERGSVLLALLFWATAGLLVLGVSVSLHRFLETCRVREEVDLMRHDLGEALGLAAFAWMRHLGSPDTRMRPSLDEGWVEGFWAGYHSPVPLDTQLGRLRCLGGRKGPNWEEWQQECRLSLRRREMTAQGVLTWILREGRLPASLLGSVVMDGSLGPPWVYPLPEPVGGDECRFKKDLRAGGGNDWGQSSVWWAFMNRPGHPDAGWLWQAAGLGGVPGELPGGLHLLREEGVLRALWWEGNLEALVLSGEGQQMQRIMLGAGQVGMDILYRPGAETWFLNGEEQVGSFPDLLVVHGDVRALRAGAGGLGVSGTDLTLLVSGQIRQEGSLVWGPEGRGRLTLVCGWDLKLGGQPTYLLTGGMEEVSTDAQIMIQGRVESERPCFWKVRGAILADGVGPGLNLSLKAEAWQGVAAGLSSAPCRMISLPQWLLGEVGA